MKKICGHFGQPCVARFAPIRGKRWSASVDMAKRWAEYSSSEDESPCPRRRSPRRGTLAAGAASGCSGAAGAASGRSGGEPAARGGSAAGASARGPADRVKPILKSRDQRRELLQGGEAPGSAARGRGGGSCSSAGGPGRSASRGRVHWGHVRTRSYCPSPAPSSSPSPSRSRSPARSCVSHSRSLSPAGSDKGREEDGEELDWRRTSFGKWRGPTHGGRHTAQSDDWWRTQRNRRRKEWQPSKLRRQFRRYDLQWDQQDSEAAAASGSALAPACAGRSIDTRDF